MLTQKNQQRLEPIRFLDYNFKIRSQLLDPLVKKHSSSDSNLLKKSGTRENSPASEKQEYSGRQRINMDYQKNQLLNNLVTRQSQNLKTPITKPPLYKNQLQIETVQFNQIIKGSPNNRVTSLTPAQKPPLYQILQNDNKRAIHILSLKQTQLKNCEYYLKTIFEAFTNKFQNEETQKLYRDHFYQTYQGIYYSQFFRPQDPYDYKNKKVYLRNKTKKITIIFDLDETLIHCNENPAGPCDVLLQIKVPNSDTINAGINVRPGIVELFESLVDDFELVVFTASHQCYAKKILDYIDPQKKYISHSFFRDQCIFTSGGVFTKDLRIFADRTLDQLVLVDNASYSYAWQLDNGIPIIPFYDNKKDVQLSQLADYLKGMIGCKDVREYNRRNLKLHLFNDQLGPQKVFEKVFGQQMDI